MSIAIVEDTSNHPNGSKFQQICFRCGDGADKIQNCPKEHTSQVKYNRLDVWQNNSTHKHNIDKQSDIQIAKIFKQLKSFNGRK